MIFRRVLLLAGLVAAIGLALAGGSGAGGSTLGFGAPVFVDQQLAGGEPEVIADPPPVG